IPPTSTLFPYTTLFRSVRLSEPSAGTLRPECGAPGIQQVHADRNRSSFRRRNGYQGRIEAVGVSGTGHGDGRGAGRRHEVVDDRSEEHTSELQSRGHLV